MYKKMQVEVEKKLNKKIIWECDFGKKAQAFDAETYELLAEIDMRKGTISYK